MGYGYTCNRCRKHFPDQDPALMGQLHERWFHTTDRGGLIAEAEGLSPEDTITFCGECVIKMLVEATK